MGFDEIGAERDCRAELRYRVVGSSRLPQHRGEHVVRVGALRLARDRLAKPRLRLRGTARLPEQHAEREGRFGRRGLQRGGAAQRLLRPLEVVALLVCDAEVVERLGVVWLVGRHALQQLDGRCEVSLVHQRGREVQAAGTERRMLRDQRLEDADGFRPFSLLHQGQPETVERVRRLRHRARWRAEGARRRRRDRPGPAARRRAAGVRVRVPGLSGRLREAARSLRRAFRAGGAWRPGNSAPRRVAAKCAPPPAADLRRPRDRASTSGSRQGGIADRTGPDPAAPLARTRRALRRRARDDPARTRACRAPLRSTDGRAQPARTCRRRRSDRLCASRTSPSASSASNASGLCATSRSRACCAGSSLPADACCRASRTTAATSRGGGAGA